MEGFRALIIWAENRKDVPIDPYTMVYGGGRFSGWKDHPRKTVIRWGHRSDAAGAYYITSDTYDDEGKRHGKRDFSPRSQDEIAESIICEQGADTMIYDGDLDDAFRALNHRWSSLPGGKQQEVTTEEAKAYFWSRLGKAPP